MLNYQIRFQYIQEDFIDCQTNELMKDIISRYRSKSKILADELLYLYNGDIINPNLNLGQINNKEKEIFISVIPKNNTKNENIIQKSNIIKCSQCNDPAIIEFLNNYKIALLDEKHGKKIINLQDFNNTQLINENDIKCSKCSNSLANSDQRNFYYCFECHKNFCFICKPLHQEHKNIVDYSIKYFKCPQHQEQNFILYCLNCKKNLCLFCKKQHETHKIINFYNLYQGENKELIGKIQKVKKLVDNIIDSLKKFKENLDVYVQINEKLNNNLLNRNLNYENLKSMKNLMETSFLKNDIDQILNNKDINKRLQKIISMNDIMNDTAINEKNNENSDVIPVINIIKKNDLNNNINGEYYENSKNSKYFFYDPEKSSDLTESKEENNQKNSLNNNKFISYEEIMQKYGDNFKDLNLTGKGKNTKKIEGNLKRIKKPKNSKKNKDLLGKKKEYEEKIRSKRGRKEKKNEDNSGVHTKMKEDNLMYTIKSNYNNWLLKVINIFLPDNQKLMKINFKEFSKIINTNENKKYLEMELSEIFSKNISDIYSKVQEKHGKNRNETIIQEIMESNNENAKKLLKIKYKDGLDLYRFKENENEGYLKKILGDEILNKIDGRVDELLTKSFERERKKNEIGANDFVSSLLVMIYNYERWFSIKTPRKPRAKKEDKKGDENNESEELEE